MAVNFIDSYWDRIINLLVGSNFNLTVFHTISDWQKSFLFSYAITSSTYGLVGNYKFVICVKLCNLCLPSVRAFVLIVLVNTNFSKASFELFVGQSSEKYLTATRFPSESKRRIFFIIGHETYNKGVS